MLEKEKNDRILHETNQIEIRNRFASYQNDSNLASGFGYTHVPNGCDSNSYHLGTSDRSKINHPVISMLVTDLGDKIC